MDGNSLSIYHCHGSSEYTRVVAHARRWRLLSRRCPAWSLNMPDLDMPFVHRGTVVKYVRRMSEMLLIDVLSDSDIVDYLNVVCLVRSVYSM